MSLDRATEIRTIAESIAKAMQPRFVSLVKLRPANQVQGIMAAAAAPQADVANSPFVLCLSEWMDLQLGMANLKRIGQTMRNIGQELEAPATEAEGIARMWQDTLFPNLKSVASDIRDYGRRVSAELAPATSRNALVTVLGQLLSAAKNAAPRTAQMFQAVKQLEGRCSGLRATLLGLHQEFQRRATNTSEQTRRLKEELRDKTEDVQRRQQLYHHYVTVAATTATYAWIPFFGWIAGASVAGVYGSKAVEEKNAIDANVRRIAEINRMLDGQERRIALLERATLGFENMGKTFGRVLPVVQHAQGVWGAIANDLGALSRQIEQATDPALDALLQLELEAAAKGWKEVAAKADDYLRYAEIKAAQSDPFGRYKTQISYGGKTYDENHVLTVDLLGVAVNGVPVKDPVFTEDRLVWQWQTDATRQDKPETADITFTGATFGGQCNFPREGKVGWTGTQF